jgi:homeodomain-containing protein
LPTVGKWRQRFVQHRSAGLHDALRPGRPRTYGDEQVAGLINRVLHSKPKNATHWSVRSVAEQSAISKSTVARYFALFGSRSSINSIEPLISANSAVTVLRSPSSGAEASCGSGPRRTEPRATGDAEASELRAACPPSAAAHCAQNFASGAFR